MGKKIQKTKGKSQKLGKVKWGKILVWIVVLATVIYVGYWISMLFFTKTLGLNDDLNVKVPVLWESIIQTNSYDFANTFAGGYYSGERFGKKAVFTVEKFNFDSKHYINTHDLAGVTYTKTILAGKEALLFQLASDTYVDRKIYIVNLNGMTFGIEVYYLKEKTNSLERSVLKKVEENIINSITFKN